jgi:hypothetical protein
MFCARFDGKSWKALQSKVSLILPVIAKISLKLSSLAASSGRLSSVLNVSQAIEPADTFNLHLEKCVLSTASSEARSQAYPPT